MKKPIEPTSFWSVRDFPKVLAYRIKVQAAIENLTIAELVSKAVSQYLKGKQAGAR